MASKVGDDPLIALAEPPPAAGANEARGTCQSRPAAGLAFRARGPACPAHLAGSYHLRRLNGSGRPAARFDLGMALYPACVLGRWGPRERRMTPPA